MIQSVFWRCFTSWLGGVRQAGFFELKGIIETLFAELGIEGAIFKHTKNNVFLSAECARISIGEDIIGIIGKVNQTILHNFDIKDSVYMLEVDMDAMLKYVRMGKKFLDLPKHPSAHRDISIVVAKEALNVDISAALWKSAGPLLKNVELIDRYEGKQIPEGKISLTYRLEYRDPARTLEEKDVLDAHNRALRELEEKFGAKLR